MKTLIYHHLDQDGYLAASIAHFYLRRAYGELDDIDFRVGTYAEDPRNGLESYDEIYVLDYSLPEDVFEEHANKIIWIDHHKTAIEKYERLNLRGERSIGTSGCKLTWHYFFPELKCPLVVELVNDRDIWAWKMGDRTAAFHEASIAFLTDYAAWKTRLTKESIVLLDVMRGESLLTHIRLILTQLIHKYSYDGIIEGYTARILNAPKEISGELHKLFRELNPNYDVYLMYVDLPPDETGRVYRVCHIFTDSPGVDVSKIAVKYGGGGHKAAAGFYKECEESETCLPIFRI
jgi:uncharacterized protein